MATSVATDPGPYPPILVLEPDAGTRELYRQQLTTAFPHGQVDCFSDMMSIHRHRKWFYAGFGHRYTLRRALQSFGYELCITNFPGETLLEHRVAALRKGSGYFQYIALTASQPKAEKIAQRLRVRFYPKDSPTLLSDIVGDYKRHKEEASRWIPGINCDGPRCSMSD